MLNWLQLLGELSLSRSIPQFVASVEQVALTLGATDAKFYLYRLYQNVLVRPGQSEPARIVDGVVPLDREEAEAPIMRRTPVDETSLVGRCALYCESVREASSVAVPVARFGSLLGVLRAENGAPEILEEYAVLVGLVHDLVRTRDEVRSLLSGTLELLVRATDLVVPQGAGHVERVARLSTKLASMMDLSAQSRQEVWDAAYYHDIGWLLLEGSADAETLHASRGADFLETTGSLRRLAPLVAAHHLPYSEELRVPLEAWVLAMAEDVDEYFAARREQDYLDVTRAFLSERARLHHPEVVDALRGLFDSGRLARMYR